MSQSSSGTPARGGEHWAEVRAHDQVMRYRRSGAGRALLLLRSAERADSLWPELLEALASHFRLIVPDVPAHAGSAADWLVDFLEGIGMPRMGIVAAEELCGPAIALAQHDADQVTRLVLVPAGPAAEAALSEALSNSVGEPSVPTLVIRRDQSADEALSLVMNFLAGDQA